MPYAELPPPPDLAGVVHCVWSFEDANPGPLERIVPDGRCELIVHAGAAFLERDAEGRWRTQPRVLFAGQVTRPLHLRASGAAGVVGIRFRHAAARAFFGRPLHEATDRRVGLVHDWGRKRCDMESAVAFVRERIQSNAQARDAVIEGCVDRIVETADALPVAALIEGCGIGRRQLERRFADAVGVGPALFASIVRFRRVFDEIDHGGTRPWTDAAAAAGYSDQSHFIREFRRFVGCTPGEFVRTSQGLATALVETVPR
jgi:AraC-like DNA-binding protein